jgi:hypothetical protein
VVASASSTRKQEPKDGSERGERGIRAAWRNTHPAARFGAFGAALGSKHFCAIQVAAADWILSNLAVGGFADAIVACPTPVATFHVDVTIEYRGNARRQTAPLDIAPAGRRTVDLAAHPATWTVGGGLAGRCLREADGSGLVAVFFLWLGAVLALRLFRLLFRGGGLGCRAICCRGGIFCRAAR